MKVRIRKLLILIVILVALVLSVIFLLPTENVADIDLDKEAQVSSSQSNTTDISSEKGKQSMEDVKSEVESSPILIEEESSQEQVSSVIEETENPPATSSTEVSQQTETNVSTESTEEYNDLLDNVPLSADLQQYILTLCSEYDIDPAIVFATIYCESGFNPNASNGVCTGLMQLHSSYFSGNLFDPYNNVSQGIKFLAELYHTHNDYSIALMCYNMGSGGASKYFNQGIYSSSYSRKVLEKANDYR